MNILVIGKFNREGFALHIAETLTDMGHAIRQFEPGIRSGRIPGRLGHRIDQALGKLHSVTDSLPLGRAVWMQGLWRVLEAGALDAVIVCHDFLWPSEVAELKRRSKALVAMWFPDAISNFGRAFFMNAPYDGLFFKDPYIVSVLDDVLRTPVWYLPECFNPARHCLPEDKTGADDVYKCDITTAGSQHSWRVAFYKNLAGYNVKLWGNPEPLWMPSGALEGMHQGRCVFDHEKVRAFRGAKIVVNNLSYAETWGVNARTFEVAAAGAFQMLDWRPGLGQLFEDGKELVSFRTIADLKEKITYWLPREAQRRAVGMAGMRRAQREHTYRLRLSLLIDTLQGLASGYPLPHISYMAH